MEKSKLIVLLRSLSAQEWKQFLTFLDSPFHNTREEVTALGHYLASLAPSLTGPLLEKRKVFDHVFPEQAYDAKRMGYLMNYLLKLGEQFLGLQHLLRAEYALHFHTMEALGERGLNKHLHFLVHKTLKGLQEDELASRRQQEYAFRIARLRNRYALSTDLEDRGGLRRATLESLDTYYVLETLQIACSQYREGLDLPPPNGGDPLATVQQFLSQRQALPPLLRAWHSLYRALAGENGHRKLTQLQDLVREHQDGIHLEELDQLLGYASRYALQRFRKGSDLYAGLGYDFIRTGVEGGAFRQAGGLDPEMVIWGVRLLLFLQRCEEARAFLDRHRGELPSKVRADAGRVAEGHIALALGQPERVHALLSALDLDTTTYRVQAQVLLIQASYAQGDLDALLSHLADLTLRLRRDKSLEPGPCEALKGFCHFLHQILRRNPKKRAVLLDQIERADPLRERRWLVQVLEAEVEA